MKHRKIFYLALFVLLVSAGFAFAHGQNEGTGKTTITFSTNWVGSDTKAAAFAPYLAAFSSKYPAYTLVVQSTPGTGSPDDLAKYFTMASAGTLPDVFNFWTSLSNMAPLVKGNHLADLSSYIQTDPVFSKEFDKPWMFDNLTRFEKGGPNYGIPAEFYFCFLYVNKTLFDQAGAPLPKTWDDVKKAIPLLKAKGIVPLGWAGNDGDLNTNLWSAFLDRFGPSSQIDAAMKAGANPDVAPALKQVYDVFQQLASMGAFPQGAAAMAQPDPIIAMYNQGKAAMFEGGTWYIGQISDTVAQNTVVMPMWTFPDGNPTDPASLVGGVSMSYMVKRLSWADPKKKQGISDFLHYVESPDLYAQWMTAGVPPLLPVKTPASANPLLIKAIAVEQNTQTLINWHAFDVPKLNTVQSNEVQGIVNGTLSASDAYNELVQAAKSAE